MIQVCNLSKKIGDRLVLDDVFAEMQSGKVTGLQGINGSGKTMLMRSLAGLIKPSAGQIFIKGKQLGKDISMPESMGILIENPAFLDSYTGLENLKMLTSLKCKVQNSVIEEALKQVGLDPADKRTYKKYSLGMKQRLGIAAAIIDSPDVVLLDEPTNALDESGIIMLKKIINAQKKRGATVVVASHDRAFLESLADRIYLFKSGKVEKLNKSEALSLQGVSCDG